ncbi:MAG: PD-(D/E)XK nuclease family protein [Candidatus Bathyarchaeia archaeon]
MTLPFDPEIEPDPETRDQLIMSLNKRFSNPRHGVHVSDLIYCLRLAVFRKLTPKPHTEKELCNFASGIACHELIQDLHGAKREVEHVWEGITATIDLLDTAKPTEIKSTKSYDHGINPHWIRQLAYYCAVRGVNVGKLIILYLSLQKPTKKNPHPDLKIIKTHKVTFRDLDVIRREILERRDRFVKACEEKDPALAPKADPEIAWLCRGCDYRTECVALEADHR